MAGWIALLRGINVGGHAKVPMAELKALCAGLGWRDVATFIQSGNVVFDSQGTAASLESALEEALEARFGFRPPTMVRSAADWARILAANPFAAEAEEDPSRVMIGIAKAKLGAGAAAAIESKGAAGERVRQAAGTVVPLSRRCGPLEDHAGRGGQSGGVAGDGAQLANGGRGRRDDAVRKLFPLLLLLPAACAGSVREAPGPAYTPAELRRLTPADLYARFVGPGGGAKAEDAALVPVGTSPISWIRISLKPEPLGPDLCVRRTFVVDLGPVHPSGRRAAGEEVRLRALRTSPGASIAAAPACAALPGRRFASFGHPLTLAEAAAILRTLASAREAAARPGPLPFRLSCVDNSRERGFRCPAALRPVLAGLPLQQAFTIARNPFPNNCDFSARDEADAIEIGDPDRSEIWDVRLRRMGTASAEVVLIRQLSRTHVKC